MRSTSVMWSRCSATSAEEARGHFDGRRGDRVGVAVVFDGVLAELQDDRQSGPFGAGDDAFGVLDRDDVEGGDGAFGVRAHEFVDRDDWHLSLIHISEPTRLGMISY